MRKRTVLLAIIFLMFLATCVFSKGAMELFADKLLYNPEDGTITAEGNVKVKGDDMFAEAKRGKASADGSKMELEEKVSIKSIKDPMLIECQRAEAVLVKGGREITCLKVKRFLHETKGVTMKAEKVIGLLKEGVFDYIKAFGNVEANMKDKNGKPIKMTSQSAYYDSKKGTVLFEGQAVAVTEGRIVEAQEFTYYLADGKIKAEGSTKVTFNLGNQEKTE